MNWTELKVLVATIASLASWDMGGVSGHVSSILFAGIVVVATYREALKYFSAAQCESVDDRPDQLVELAA